MGRLNPDCPKCNANLYSVYIRKKQDYTTLHNNFYCKNCKVLYQIDISEIKKNSLEKDKVFDLLKKMVDVPKGDKQFRRFYEEVKGLVKKGEEQGVENVKKY